MLFTQENIKNGGSILFLLGKYYSISQLIRLYLGIAYCFFGI